MSSKSLQAIAARLTSKDRALRLFPDKVYPALNLHGRIVHALGEAIIRSEIPCGSLLPSEAELCEAFGVSRTAVREALRVLSAKNLIDARQKVGSRVKPRWSWNLMDPDVLHWYRLASTQDAVAASLIELRRIIEPAAAELAASRATESDLTRMLAACRRMANAGKDLEAFLSADLEFHNAVLIAAHNDALLELAHPLTTALLAAFEQSTRKDPSAARRALPLHEAVARAVHRRKPSKARSTMTICISSDDVHPGTSRPARRAAGSR